MGYTPIPKPEVRQNKLEADTRGKGGGDSETRLECHAFPLSALLSTSGSSTKFMRAGSTRSINKLLKANDHGGEKEMILVLKFFQFLGKFPACLSPE